MDDVQSERMISAGINRLERGIIDAHCHIASTDFTPLSFIEGAVDNMVCRLSAFSARPNRKKLLDLYLKKMQDPNCDELVSEMDKAGIEKSILLLPDLTFALKDSKLTIAEMFERHHAILKSKPDKFLVFAGVDPRWGKDGIQLFERGITEYGFRGLKLYAPCGYSPSDKSLYPFYEICMEHQFPVVTHIGATSPALAFDTSLPIQVDRAAQDFPTVNFILAHGGTNYAQECIMMCAYRPNIYLDVSGFHSKPPEHLTSLFLHNINHKIIFGTDWPVFRMQGDQSNVISSLLEDDGPLKDLSANDLGRFFSRTIESLLVQSQ